MEIWDAYNKGETISYLWVSKKELLEFIQSDKFIQTHKKRMSEYLNSIS